MQKNSTFLLLILLPFASKTMEQKEESHHRPFTVAEDANSQKSISKGAQFEITKLLEFKTDHNDPRWNDLFQEISFYDKYSESLKLLLINDSNFNANNLDKEKALDTACAMGALKNITLLLNHGANPNKTNAYGQIILIKAVEEGQLPVVKLLLQHNIINILEANLVQAALMVAVEDDFIATISHDKNNNLRKNIVLSLLNGGANPLSANKQEKNAIDIAYENGFGDLAELMKGYAEIS